MAGNQEKLKKIACLVKIWWFADALVCNKAGSGVRVCLLSFVEAKKIIVNNISLSFERGYGFVCLLIFQSGVNTRIFFCRFSDVWTGFL